MITISQLRVAHTKYNTKYFNGVLSMPNFVLGKHRSRLGHYCISRNEIMISVFFKRSEDDFMQTLIHEMIHQYIQEQRIIDNGPHGRKFKSIAERINRDGWNIRRTTYVPKDVEVNIVKTYHIFVIEYGDERCFAMRVCGANVNEYKRYLERRGYKYYYYTTKNAIFARYTENRSGLRGKEISKNDWLNGKYK